MLVFDLQAPRALGLAVPPMLIAIVDDIIEQ
jgi:hypothetical protein